MGRVGNLGRLIVFEVSDSSVLTFNSMKKKVSAKWATNGGIETEPCSFYLGAGLDEVSFDIQLNAQLGVKPRTILERLCSAAGNGQSYRLVVGGKKIGVYYVSKVSESWDVVFNNGELISAKVSITLKEYNEPSDELTVVERAERVEQQTVSTETATSATTNTYTVVKGDNLCKIAKRFYGDESKYVAIYNANASVIEERAKKDGKKSSNNGYWIYPGTVLVIP